MTYTSKEIAKIVDGQLCADEDIVITGLGTPENSCKGKIVCLFNKIDKLPSASLFIVPNDIDLNINCIKVNNPKLAFIKMLKLFYKNKIISDPIISPNANIHVTSNIDESSTVHANVTISKNVTIGKNCIIYPGVYIGPNSIIGNDTILKPNVVIEHDVTIKNNVIIHAGSVIGADGFGYLEIDGVLNKIPQVGSVIIEDNVEIGSNVCIDRGTIDSTIIQKGSKIDNLVQIGHNCNIGENTILVSQVGISGSCNIGKNSILAGQVGVSDHVNLDENTVVLSKSGISKSFTGKNKQLWGIPARDASEMRKIVILRDKLPEIYKRLKALENKINIK